MTTELNYSSILGTKINITDMEKTVSYIEQHLDELKGHYICCLLYTSDAADEL